MGETRPTLKSCVESVYYWDIPVWIIPLEFKIEPLNP